MQNSNTGSCYILRTRIDSTSNQDACNRIVDWAVKKQSEYVVAANVHVVTTAWLNPAYRNTIDKASLVVPDGMPLVKGICWLSGKKQTRVYGPDLMLSLCARAEEKGISIYLYGGTNTTLDRLSRRLSDRFPNMRISGMHSPPFRPLTESEDLQDAERINLSGAGIVFVGLGCPKQEKWMAQQASSLNSVTVGVGAAFRFHSGEISQAPRWMMQSGLEWLYRLYREPNRLWRRYFINNTLFLTLFGCQYIVQILLKRKSKVIM